MPPRRLLFLYLTFLGAISVYYAFHHMRMRDPYAMADYLINYTGGFVRRGLLGEILRLLSLATHINALWFAFLVQAAAFVFFLAVVYRLTLPLRWTYSLAALVFCPATCAFMALNPAESMRKEILLYAVLALVCLPFFARLRDTSIVLLLFILAPFLVLSHDSLVLYMPYLFAAVALQAGSLTRACKLVALPALATLIAAIAVATHPGTQATAAAVCSSLGATLQPFGSPNINLCSGSVVWLQISFTQAHDFTLSFIKNLHYFRVYLRLLPLVFLPSAFILTTLYRRYHLRREVVFVLACSLVAWLASSLVFYTGIDWGRWIGIHAICLMLLLLLLSQRAAQQPQPDPTPLPRIRRLALNTAVFLYAFTWALPPVVTPSNRAGYIGLYLYFRDVHQHRQT
jgi:hypothetical protein